MNITIKSSRTVGGRIAAPPSKSMAHRAVLCAALAKGTSHLHHLAFSKDISATLGAAGRLCARVTTGENDAVVEGLGRFLPVDAPVDCCESGSTLRFLIPLASLTGQEVTFTGRGRLMERPQSVYKTLYQQQGLRFEQGADRLTVEGALTPGEYELAGNVSSQFISGLLFALPLLGGTSTLHLIPPVESRSYIDMTRAVQHAFGVESRWLDENTLEIPGGQHYLPGDYTVEGDYSQAAFPAVLGAVTGGVAITGLSEETLQGDAAILEILRRCGARFTRTGQGVVFEKAPLHGTDIDLADCPDLGPVLMVLGLLPRKMRQSCRSQLSLATCSTVMLGTLLISSNQNYTLEQSIAFGLGSGLGYTFIVFIVREGRRRLRSKAVPAIFQGLPSSMIYIGVLSLAIYALVGHSVVL